MYFLSYFFFFLFFFYFLCVVLFKAPPPPPPPATDIYCLSGACYTRKKDGERGKEGNRL
jgi:hypothetical protein